MPMHPQIRDAVAEYVWRLQTARFAISQAQHDFAKVIGEDGVSTLFRANKVIERLEDHLREKSGLDPR